MIIRNVERINRVFLTIASVVSIAIYYFLEAFPDNYYEISSDVELPNYVLYSLNSAVFSVHYWVGIWVVIPLLFHLGLLLFQRKTFIDGLHKVVILSVTFSILVMILSSLAFPYLLGDGLRGLLNSVFAESFNLYLALGVFFTLFALETFWVIKLSEIKTHLPIIGSLPSMPKLSIPGFKLPIGSLRTKKEQTATDERENLDDKRELIEVKPKESDFKKSQTIPPEEMESLNNSDNFSDLEKIESVQVNIDGNEPKLVKSSMTKILSLKRSNGANDDQYYRLVGEKKLGMGSNENTHPQEKYFEDITNRIEEKLAEFKIDGRIENVLKGPVVDTFELGLGSGVKVSKVNSSAEDLSLALYGAPIRVVYPMKGRTTIGIEVPRNPREIIYLDEIVSSQEFQKSQFLLPLAMGKDSFGKPFVVDLANMPHMLVAGSTGAGKSVFINSILVSLLIKKSPRQMKLILIDPKQLELALYSNLPHLLTPVVTDSKNASITLLWVVQEMERRYSILKELGVRNIEGFNKKIKTATPEMLGKIHQFYQDNSAEEYELPFIVVIIDEFADLILTKSGKDIENNICRLAAKARASGIHLIIATQRPSVDVITGLIKSNFPTRVSFRVTTSVDSRTILNAIGAERLLGKGDMLYKHGVETVRIHSSYVEEDEIEALTANLGAIGQMFDPSALEFIENGGPNEFADTTKGLNFSDSGDGSDKDDLYEEAVKVVIECRSASASMLQRRLKVGYNRAANLIDMMEAKGVVGPAQGSKPRKVLMESAT
jgi:S-DNA-T family DNA segregation ATPase FtsK/SpoIIIE